MTTANKREKYLYKIMPYMRKNGLSTLKMDDIAKYMDISKATLYKHFQSKEEIVESVVYLYTNYIRGQEVSADNSTTFVQQFQHISEQSLMLAAYVSDIFLQDLLTLFPALHEKIMLAQKERNQQLKQFFVAGIQEGVFNPVNSDIFMMQDELVLRRLLDPSFSIQYDITMKRSILDFYQMKAHQMISPTHLSALDENAMEVIVSTLIQKLN
ncbi:TetR/AcrR family transcriptional regulator [Paenibacillus sp. ACRRX]|uniref:TetR/AcrR family transcriptional regulator n=1 Tax=Paenibacillus sp. ACRRX TaxID=2918206 RepID=UPI001EF4D2F1|nr:TetR/AcrR family transcriptional regulator [Paenibacillus sp. ACRRX]MCG7406641.1 TetR/AcrR family transcriptional regulator [Paenibacillus sp. ACRRX]